MEPTLGQAVSWTDVFIESLQSLWFGALGIVPKILLAIIIFLIGWLLASLVRQAVEHAIKTIKLDKALAHTGLDNVVRRAGYKLSSGKFLGEIFKWFVIILFLKLSLDVVDLNAVDDFFNEVLGYLPSVIVSVIVLFAGSLIADAMAKIVEGSARAAEIGSHRFMGTATRWIIWIFIILIVLNELNIATQFILTIFTGIVAMLALAGGLAFGLGGRDAAAKTIERVKRSLGTDKTA